MVRIRRQGEMRDKIEKLAKKIGKMDRRLGEDLFALALTQPKDYLEINPDEMEAFINPEKAEDTLEIPEISI